jgi:hypothetical protein
MSNQNTVSGVYQLPKMLVSDTNEHALVVPGPTPPSGVTWAVPYYETSLPNNGPNPYPGFPSPAFPVNSGLVLSPPTDIAGSVLDGRPFRLRMTGVMTNPGGGACALKFYQVAFAQLGVIGAAGSVTAAGAPGTGATNFSNVALGTANSHFWAEAVLTWDSSLVRIDGYTQGQTLATVLAITTIGTPVTSGVATFNQLNFMPSVTFATGNAGNSLTIQEFVIDRY